LQPFQPLAIRWSGKSELRNLLAAEWVGGLQHLDGAALMPGFYLNELMVRLLPRDDPHPALFDDFLATLGILAEHEAVSGRELTEPILRRFECNLLREMGYAPAFDREADGETPIDPKGLYQVAPQTGISRVDGKLEAREPGSSDGVFPGTTLLALAGAGGSIEQAIGVLESPEVAADCKKLLRSLLGHHLGDDGLSSRQIMRELVRI
jgi:DNA repair protein RecO (recombination protein O)